MADSDEDVPIESAVVSRAVQPGTTSRPATPPNAGASPPLRTSGPNKSKLETNPHVSPDGLITEEPEVSLEALDTEAKPRLRLAALQASSSSTSSSDSPASVRRYGIEEIRKLKKTDDDISSMTSSHAKEFYSQQNSIIEMYEGVEAQKKGDDKEGESEDKDVEDEQRTSVRIAIYASFGVNIFLVVMKLFLAIKSNSMTVIASALDSILDILSGSVIFLVSCCMRRTNRYDYPVGKTRLEPIGIVIFATLMFSTALQLVIESTKRISGGKVEIVIDVWVLSGLVLTIALKLALFLYCRLVKNSSSVEALAQDHRNDVITNSFTIAATLISFYTEYWYVDGVGGIGIGVYIMQVWVRTALENIRILTGGVAPPELLKKWTYLTLHHHPAVIAVDTVRAYHLAEGFVTEVDIVLPPDMPLREAHDIGEALQHKLEAQPEVERAFVHLDYEFDHKPEH